MHPIFLKLLSVLSRRTALCPVLLALTLVCVSKSQAQSVHWDPPGGTLPAGLLSELTLTFENCEPKGDPAPPKVPGLMLALRGKSQNISIVNFSKSVATVYSFAARLESKQGAEIPAFTVETDKGPVTVPSVRFDAGQAAIGQSNLSIDEIAQSQLQPASPEVWAGEVFALSYQITVLKRYYHQIASTPEWDPGVLVVEEWTKPELQEENSKSGPVYKIQYKTRAYAKNPGELTLNGAQQLLNIRTGSSTSFFGSTPELQQLSIASSQPTLNVRPLPTPVPASFSGAVGQFKLSSKIVPLDAKAGEPVTWTLELSGTGNWPAIQALPARSVPKSFEVIQPQARRVVPEGKLFDATLSEDVVMLPRQAGTYVIPAVSLSYFDPKSGQYKTLSSERASITVSAAASPASTSLQTGASSSAVQPPPGAPRPPVPPEPLPSDPLADGAKAAVPSPIHQVVLLGLSVWLLLPVVWLCLALRRAWYSDRDYTRRRARTSLASLLSPKSFSPARARILAWQREAGRLLGLPSASPSLNALRKALAGLPESRTKAWLQLWQDAETYLYAKEGALPADWSSRARDQLASHHLPRFNPLRALLPRHLLPWWFLLVFIVSVPSTQTLSAAPKPVDLYAKGDFAAAAELWSREVQAHPTDWSARHNLGLCLLQQNQAGAALAHLGAALVHNPSDATIRKNFRLAAGQAGVTPVRLSELASDSPLSTLARLRGPAGWQSLLLLALALSALACLLYLLRGYGFRPRFMPGCRLCTLLLLGALLLAATSLTALHRYGPLADERAAMVRQNSTLRSIPTEADATQKTSAIGAGNLVLVDKAFLGWRHVSLPSGEEGWLRNGDLVPLWRKD